MSLLGPGSSPLELGRVYLEPREAVPSQREMVFESDTLQSVWCLILSALSQLKIKSD